MSFFFVVLGQTLQSLDLGANADSSGKPVRVWSHVASIVLDLSRPKFK